MVRGVHIQRTAASGAATDHGIAEHLQIANRMPGAWRPYPAALREIGEGIFLQEDALPAGKREAARPTTGLIPQHLDVIVRAGTRRAPVIVIAEERPAADIIQRDVIFDDDIVRRMCNLRRDVYRYGAHITSNTVEAILSDPDVSDDMKRECIRFHINRAGHVRLRRIQELASFNQQAVAIDHRDSIAVCAIDTVESARLDNDIGVVPLHASPRPGTKVQAIATESLEQNTAKPCASDAIETDEMSELRHPVDLGRRPQLDIVDMKAEKIARDVG